MSVKKKVFGTLCVALMLMSTSTSVFASGASYSVHDDEVRSTLNDVKNQLEIIKKYLAVVEEKEKSMDLLEKNAADRTNDSMQKLSVDSSSSLVSDANSFMSEQDANPNSQQGRTNKQDWQRVLALVGKGKGGFLELFMKNLAADGFAFTNYIKGLDTFKISIGDFSAQFKGISTGSNYNGLKSPSSIKKVYLQNMGVLAEQREKILNERMEVYKKRKELNEKAKKNLEEISKAKDSKSDAKESLASAIKASQGLLGSNLLSKGFNINDLGNVLSSKNMQTIFMKEETESITGSQEKTTSAVAQDLALKITDSDVKNFDVHVNIKLGKLNALASLNDLNFTIALAEAERNTVGGLKVNSKGKKHKCAFGDKYKN